MDMTITEQQLDKFVRCLQNEEKSIATIRKYARDARRFAAYLGDSPLTQDAAVSYKAALTRSYAPASVNAMLAGLNCFLQCIGREDCRVRRLRVQYQTYCPEEKELTYTEYVLLVRTAQQAGRARTALLLQTLCATGIHLFARSFYALDTGLGKLADLLGHSSIETTRLYIRSTGAEHRRCLERMRLVI